jgi:hypothetical protein
LKESNWLKSSSKQVLTLPGILKVKQASSNASIALGRLFNAIDLCCSPHMRLSLIIKPTFMTLQFDKADADRQQNPQPVMHVMQ